MTEFQRQILDSVITLVTSKRETIEIEGCGISEFYLLCKCRNLKIYIYDDGFEVFGETISERYETEELETVDFAKSTIKEILTKHLN